MPMADNRYDTAGSARQPQPANRFDEAAATWDDTPRRRQMSETITRAVQQTIPLRKDWRVLEYGCGTATLGFLLAPHVGEVVAADASAGMVEQVRTIHTVTKNNRQYDIFLLAAHLPGEHHGDAGSTA
jgi:ubiquinone/menaquinone biosynthesis C-methylase UbiE